MIHVIKSQLAGPSWAAAPALRQTRVADRSGRDENGTTQLKQLLLFKVVLQCITYEVNLEGSGEVAVTNWQNMHCLNIFLIAISNRNQLSESLFYLIYKHSFTITSTGKSDLVV